MKQLTREYIEKESEFSGNIERLWSENDIKNELFMVDERSSILLIHFLK